jgi:tetratricopeptide (TPR) repeat protein
MQWVSLLISFLALAISGYGIFERRRAVHRDLRGQFASTTRELHGLSNSEEDYEGEAAQQFRRALLTQQAIALEEMVDSRQLTSEEYCTLANSLDWLGETKQAIRYWQKATKLTGEIPGIMHAAPWRGYAWSCFEDGQLPQARRAVRQALALTPHDHDRNRWDVVQTCADWRRLEERLPSGQGQPDEPLDHARRVLQEVQDPDMRRQMEELLREDDRPGSRLLGPDGLPI